jgi:serine/threonine-protein kinase RsbW
MRPAGAHEYGHTGHSAVMSLDQPSGPPPRSARLDCWSLTSPADLPGLRSDLVALLVKQRIPADRALDALPDKVSVVATELASNALRHGLPPAQVCLYRGPADFVVDVTDTNPGQPPQRWPWQTFGLRIAGGFADAIGWYIDGPIKHVWAHFALPDWQSGLTD